MDSPDRYHWYGEEPFPWIGLGLGTVLGFVVMPLVGWLLLELVDCDLGME